MPHGDYVDLGGVAHSLLEDGFHLGSGVDLALEGEEGHLLPSRERKTRPFRKRARGATIPPDESGRFSHPRTPSFFYPYVQGTNLGGDRITYACCATNPYT